MHLSSLIRMHKFLEKHLKPGDKLLDVGSRTSRDGEPTYRQLLDILEIECDYTGLDIEAGENVTLVVEDPHCWMEVDTEFDIVISGQMLEHSEFFWVTFQEMVRVLKPGGYMCIVAPKLQKQHRFPVDCWRFYPDAMHALAKWTGIKCLSAETDHCHYDVMPTRPIDCVGVFQK
jgi:ubiquinone/menaquinone biosynthesis C-methylase UbiE